MSRPDVMTSESEEREPNSTAPVAEAADASAREGTPLPHAATPEARRPPFWRNILRRERPNVSPETPSYNPAELAILKEQLDNEIHRISQDQSMFEAQRRFVINELLEARRTESAKFLPAVAARIRAGEQLTEPEMMLVADDLVRNRFEASVVNEKVLSLTGQKNIKELIKSRDLIPEDIEGLNLPDSEKASLKQWWDRHGWLRKGLGKTATTAVVGGTLILLTGGAGAVFAVGLVGSGIANLGVEKWRSVAERKLRKQEMQGIVNDVIASEQAAKKILELRGQGAEAQGAYHEGVIELVNALQKTSQETLDARTKLNENQRKWFWRGLGASVVGASIGVGAYELLSGGFAAATQAKLELAQKTGETFKVRTHDVKFVHDAWRWLIGNDDLQGKLRAFQEGAKGVVEHGTTGMAHASELWHGGVGVAAELKARVGEVLYRRVVEEFLKASGSLLTGILVSESGYAIWDKANRRKAASTLEQGAAAQGKTLESTKAASIAAKEALDRQAAERAEEERAKPKVGDLYNIPDDTTFGSGEAAFKYGGRVEIIGQNEAGHFRVRLVDNLDLETLPTTEVVLTAQQINGFERGPYTADQKNRGFSAEGYTGSDQRYKPNLEKLGRPGEHFLIFFKDADWPAPLKKAVEAEPDIKIRAVSPPNFKRNEIELEDESGKRYQVRLTLVIRWLQSVVDTPVGAVGSAETAPTPAAAPASLEGRPAPERAKVEPKPKQIWGKRANPEEMIVVDRIDEEEGHKVIRGRVYDQARNQARGVILPIEDFDAFTHDWRFINDFI